MTSDLFAEAALFRIVSEQIRLQNYRRDYDQRIDISLSNKETALLMRMLSVALRELER